MMRRGTFKQMKYTNKTLVLNNIRQNQTTSRAQIAKDTLLTPPTVSSIVKELIEEKIVLEKEVLGESQGGRKPKLLAINDNAYYIFGVDVSSRKLNGIICNLNGNILYEKEIQIKKPNEQEFIDKIKEVINDLIRFTKNGNKEILGLGIAMNGIVDSEDGIALFAPGLNLKNIPLKEIIEKEYDFEVKVENDVRAMVLAESWFNGESKHDNLILVNIGYGVGAGMMIDGQLFRGNNDIAGEFGHTVINYENGRKCDCGNHGCIETIISGSAIEKVARKQKLIKPNETAKRVNELANAGDEHALKIYRDLGTALGYGLINLIHLVNPDKIILSGGVTNAHKHFLPHTNKIIKKSVIVKTVGATAVEVSSFKNNSAALGACSLFLENLYNEQPHI